jgi:hypothetical protein
MVETEKAEDRVFDGEQYVMVNKEQLLNEAMQFDNIKQYKLMNYFLRSMNRTNALVVSQNVLCKVLGCSRKTVHNVVQSLHELRMINIYKIGVQNCYVINSEVAWSTNRGKKEWAIFEATMVVNYDEQSEEYRKLWNKKLQPVTKQMVLNFEEA